MKYMFNAVNVISVIFELLIAVDYFKTVSKKKEINRWVSIIVYGIFIAVNSSVLFFANKQAVITIVMIASVFTLSFIYKLSNLKRIIFSVILAVLSVLFEMLIGMVLTVLSGLTIEEFKGNLIFYIQFVLVSKLFMLVVIRLFGYFSIRSETKLSPWLFAPYIILPIATFLAAYVMSEYINKTKDAYLIQITAFSVIALIISNVLLFYLVEMQIKETENRSKEMLIHQQIQNKADYYQELAEKQRMSNKTMHDLKNRFFALGKLIKNNPSAAAEEFEKISENFMAVSAMTYTGIDSIDALINAKKQKMQECNISFTHKLSMPKETAIEPIELCVVLGNLLDNAIEANEKLPEDNRFILLSAIQKQGYLSIKISNPVKEKVRIKNNEIYTTKINKELHGFGIQSVKEIAEKHDGAITFEQNEGVFTVIVMLNNS